MVYLAPPERLAILPAFPGWAETVDQRTARYESIANDIAAVVLDPEEKPLYGGPQGRGQTAALIVAVAFMESGFAPDVDKGPCYRGKDGKGLRCDSGRSASIMQIMVGDGRTKDGWKKADLFQDRTKAVRAALHLMHMSFAWGRSRVGARLERGSLENPEMLFLDGYAGNTSLAHKRAVQRILLGRKLMGRPAMPLDSAEVLK